ncbi:MAG: SDR family NAD(P)-dependent oxidoreductase [Holdemania massiliensis]
MIYKEGLLEGKVALVTGANRGLGYAMCVGLAENGADIFNIGHGDDTGIREAIEKLGRRYHYMKADLSKPTKALTDEIVAEVVAVYGHLDILLNNAGVNRRAPFLEYAEADWDYTLNLNLKQVFLLSQSAANQMVKQGTRGKIINIASMLSFTGGILVPAYTASKSAIMGLTKEMANELSSQGINVNAIAPGYMKTPLTQAMQDDPVRNKEVLDRLPIGYWGDPSVLQGPVVFLASEASDYICGATIPVDGGWLAHILINNSKMLNSLDAAVFILSKLRFGDQIRL